MKLLALNAIENEGTMRIAVNPAYVVTYVDNGDKTTRLLINDHYIDVEESFEEVMQLLGFDCGWKMP